MKRLLMFIGFLVLLLVPILAQEGPGGWQDLYDNYGVFFATYLGIAGVASFLSEYVIRLLKLKEKWQKVVIVSLLAVGVSFLGMVINIGYLAEATWWETALWGGLSAAAAAGLRSTNLLFVKTIVDFVIGYIKTKEPKSEVD